MAALLDRLRGELQSSRKARKAAQTLVLGTVLSDIENHHISMQRDLTDDDVVDVLRRAIKRRRESIDAFDKGGRTELADRERAEVELLSQYLPASVSDDEVRVAVRAAIVGGAKTLGAVMGKVVPQFKGRAEGGVINGIAREELGASA
jgi:uncharacterized protein YqeY